MARDVDSKTARLFDRRTVDRNIKKGLISRKDYDKHLKGLDDVADKGVYGGTDPEPAEVDEPDEPEPAAAAAPPPSPGSNSQGH
jgi:hypothetical protein